MPEKKQEPGPIVQRGLTTDIIGAVAVIAAGPATVTAQHLLNRPPKDQPQHVELPPGVQKED
jgi:hypothetical protein